MDVNTQQNASIVEEAAMAAEHMAGQAQVLVEAVAKFKVAADAGHRHLPGSGEESSGFLGGRQRSGFSAEQSDVDTGSGGVEGARQLESGPVKVIAPAGFLTGA